MAKIQKNDREKKIYEYHAEMCKVFSHPTRLEIINTLRDSEVNVTDLSTKIGIDMGNLSQHLGMMRDRRILYHPERRECCLLPADKSKDVKRL